ncbi:hypothetical protein N7462_003380 [Penicillium macrosclerotiorum]|uniref:uncharacterized protein n=1 Tax=Penicillium macrosclerotiorum TaxID=303699 RepID=UPI0025499377|nr:uncharacterized protein N7462_003380 [Penicillium macrosclerotiorum]KAJ5688988.1 hypothetical protein N7462_003380 [Penicillium macrosclerotiorum]
MDPTAFSFDSTSNDSTIFDQVLNQAEKELLHMSPSLDISTLDFLILPGGISDMFRAENLEYLAYFTSTKGMSSFTDQASFSRRQKIISEAYERKLRNETLNTKLSKTGNKKIQKSPIKWTPDPLSLRSNEIVGLMRSVISNKKNDEIIKLEWSPQVQHLCSYFFSPRNIRRFLEYFWSLWYPHCPIVHKPLFDTSSVLTPLLCVMVVIGACLSPYKEEPEISRTWIDSIEELVFSNECFGSDAKPFQDDENSKKERVQYIQASYLVCSLQKREGTEEAQARMRRFRHVSMVALARRIGPKAASHRHLGLQKPSESWWRQFAQEEELIRTIIFIFLIDAALTILHNSPPRMVVLELKMDVACPEACFQAESANDCFEALQPWASSRFGAKRLSIVSALHNSLVFESTLAPIQTGLKNWRRIWDERVAEDAELSDTPENMWKQVGFLQQASEFWQLARIMADKIMSTSHDEDDNAAEVSEPRYDHTDMGYVNELIMEYRKLNLGVN